MTLAMDLPPFNPSPVGKNRNISFLYRLFGIIMVGHFVLYIYISWRLRALHGLFWLSHVGTLIGGIGVLTRRPLIISFALVSLFNHHLFWLLDTCWWLITGEFLWGITSYLEDATALDWVRSANHFFSVPFLLICAIIQGKVHKWAWVWSVGLFAFLAIISALFLPYFANVNCALYPCQGLERPFSFLFGSSGHPLSLYLLFIIGFNGIFNYLPVNLLLALLIPRIRIWGLRFSRRRG